MKKRQQAYFKAFLVLALASMPKAFAAQWSLKADIERGSFDEKNYLTIGRFEGPLSGFKFGAMLRYQDFGEFYHRSETFTELFFNTPPENKRLASLNYSHSLIWQAAEGLAPFLTLGIGWVQTQATIPSSNYIDNHHDPYFMSDFSTSTHVKSKGFQYFYAFGLASKLMDRLELLATFSTAKYQQLAITQKKLHSEATYTKISPANKLDYYSFAIGVNYALQAETNAHYHQ